MNLPLPPGPERLPPEPGLGGHQGGWAYRPPSNLASAYWVLGIVAVLSALARAWVQLAVVAVVILAVALARRWSARRRARRAGPASAPA